MEETTAPQVPEEVSKQHKDMCDHMATVIEVPPPSTRYNVKLDFEDTVDCLKKLTGLCIYLQRVVNQNADFMGGIRDRGLDIMNHLEERLRNQEERTAELQRGLNVLDGQIKEIVSRLTPPAPEPCVINMKPCFYIRGKEVSKKEYKQFEKEQSRKEKAMATYPPEIIAMLQETESGFP
jgi:hypothetical protein